jgi:hypothetical protein
VQPILSGEDVQVLSQNTQIYHCNGRRKTMKGKKNMKTITNKICGTLAVSVLAFACFDTASALTVYPINNGFEQPDLGSGCGAYQYNPPSPGWAFVNSSGIAANESCFDVAGATNGNNNNGATSTSGQAGLLQGGDGTLAGVSFSQTLSLPTAGNWVAYFSLEGRAANDGANGVNVFLDGVQVGSTLFPANLGSFNGASVNLGNVTSGSHTIGFAGTIPEGDHTTFVDKRSPGEWRDRRPIRLH